TYFELVVSIAQVLTLGSVKIFDLFEINIVVPFFVLRLRFAYWINFIQWQFHSIKQIYFIFITIINIKFFTI
ncbi:hypothetical protein BpHYR1_043662, partial [Brachionus plicatilis]